MFNKFQELIDLSNKTGKLLHEVIMEWEMLENGTDPKELIKTSEKLVTQMIESYREKMQDHSNSLTGWTGFNTHLYKKHIDNNKSFFNNIISKGILASFATSENNASMGRIVACPTAGSSGVIPGVFIALYEEKNIEIEKLAEGLIVASAVGEFIRRKASLSGAVGGCQAEIGSAISMGAAALSYISTKNNDNVVNSASLALKFIMGLICDPVGGFVEIPCVKRNPAGTVLAFTAAEMACAGIKSAIPFDEVITAMGKVGRIMHEDLKETGKGGVANTSTAKKMLLEFSSNKKI
jgi:L-serine dehydratase